MKWEKTYDSRLGCAVHRSGELVVLITRDGPEKFWHLSISTKTRYPVWDEIKEARYDLIPDEVTMAMLLPPKSEYVNFHPNTFHLHEMRENVHRIVIARP